MFAAVAEDNQAAESVAQRLRIVVHGLRLRFGPVYEAAERWIMFLRLLILNL